MNLIESIKKLREEAVVASDFMQAVLCDIALGVAVFDKDGYPLYENPNLYEAAWSIDAEIAQPKALAMCKAALCG